MNIVKIKSGKELGYAFGGRYAYLPCKICNSYKWVRYSQYKEGIRLCLSCQIKTQKNNAYNKGKYHPAWKGGKFTNKNGYTKIWLHPQDFFYPMANKLGYVAEHRLVIAKSLGRCLHSWEVVHHRNHIKTDNHLENLQLVTELGHRQIEELLKYILKLESRIKELESK